MSRNAGFSDDEDDFDDFFDSPKRKSSGQKDVYGSLTQNKPVSKNGRKYKNVEVTVSDSDESGTEHNVRKITATVPHATMSQDDYSDNSDDDDYSARQNSSGKSNQKLGTSDSGSGGQAQTQSESVRPKSSRGLERKNRKASGSGNTGTRETNKNTSDDYSSDSESSYTSGSTTTDSEDDMTDVSPLATPTTKKRVEIGGATYMGGNSSHKPPKSPLSHNRPKSGSSTHAGSSSRFERLLEPNKDTMNLNLLMQAILEMEKGRETPTLPSEETRVKKQFVVPATAASRASASKRNMSFRNDQAKEIDRENQRLMEKIINYSVAVKKKKKAQMVKQQPVTVEKRLTPSAVNRQKEQRRIEQENMAMLRRLESAKSTRNVNRNDLLTDFNKKTLFGVPMSVVHPEIPKKKKSPYEIPPYLDEGRLHSHSMSSLNLNNSMVSSAGRKPARPQSAKSAPRPSSAKSAPRRPQSAHAAPGTISSRPTSAKRRPLSAHRPPAMAKPAWDERW